MIEYTLKSGLTIRPDDIYELESRGLSEKEIAWSLGISRTWLWQIRCYLGCPDRSRSDKGTKR